MIRSEDLHPEEHLAVFGTRADHRVEIWRDVHGPGRQLFRDEVAVCSRCRHVTLTPGPCLGTTGRTVRRVDAMSPDEFKRWGRRMSDRQLKAPVREPCPGTRMHPTAELGKRWLEGERIQK
ncbi:hypothetical protein LCGC14_1535000 [marine sediment metagenome]|uniref:Uncharacterized protein n=1 Tax=marine sediment metagenome TaxID=412755 RepID=A0A0F9LAI5_9ZZZZ